MRVDWLRSNLKTKGQFTSEVFFFEATFAEFAKFVRKAFCAVIELYSFR